MTPIALVEAGATLLWAYAGVCLAEIALRIARSERRAHVPVVAELLGNLVPAMILLVIVVLFGALFGLPSVVVLIALLFPAGLAYGAHVTLAEMAAETGHRSVALRVLLGLALGAAIIVYRQVL